MPAERTYERTHPWITFNFNLGSLSHKTWIELGEATSKCQQLAGAPLKPTVSDQLMRVYLSKGAHGTSAIEGNTLSEAEVRQRVDGDLPLPPSKEYLGHEIDSIVRVFNETAHGFVVGTSEPLSITTLNHWNKLMLDGQPVDDSVVPGEIRDHSVGVADYRGAPAEDCSYLLEKLCEWLHSEQFTAPTTAEYMVFPLAVVRALLAHLYIAWIHPYGDGNGRVARMAEFQLLVEAGLPWPACHLLSNHYHATRGAYYRALSRTSKVDGYPVEEFVTYAIQGFVDQLREQWQVVRDHQMEVTWENHVHDVFHDHDTPAKVRQKRIALDLDPNTPTALNKVRQISVRIAEAYGGKTAKTVSRDVNALEQLNLIKRVKGGILPNRYLIKAFLPQAVDR